MYQVRFDSVKFAGMILKSVFSRGSTSKTTSVNNNIEQQTGTTSKLPQTAQDVNPLMIRPSSPMVVIIQKYSGHTLVTHASCS